MGYTVNYCIVLCICLQSILQIGQCQKPSKSWKFLIFIIVFKTPVESIVWWKMNFYVTILEAATVCQDPLSGASGDAATHECLGCICEASSKFCNTKMGCVAGGTLCGPFLLSRGFWVDGGRCTDGGASGKYPNSYALI